MMLKHNLEQISQVRTQVELIEFQIKRRTWNWIVHKIHKESVVEKWSRKCSTVDYQERMV